MESNRTKRNELLAQKIIRNLASRNITGYYAANREEALRKALELIPRGASVSWGGSASITEIGLKNAVQCGDYTVYDRDSAADKEEKRRVELQAFGADWFLASANAVTEDGILVNIDGNGNRVACLVYGPEHVLFIVGMNKVVRDLDAAVSRARNEAAPVNATRFQGKTPCCATGSCANCLSPDSICCQFLVTRYERHPGRYHLILVNDSLGF